jgi:hypothetical protein
VYLTLRVNADPAQWTVSGTDPVSLAEEIAAAAGPLVIPVLEPVRGRLILSARAAGSVAVAESPERGTGWIPSDVNAPYSLLYVPGAPEGDAAAPGFSVPPSVDVHACEQSIVKAMREGTTVSVAMTDGVRDGVIVLNGATLPFAALYPTR